VSTVSAVSGNGSKHSKGFEPLQRLNWPNGSNVSSPGF